MKYPNGMKKSVNAQRSHTSFSNRGMTLEEDINLTNQYYLEENVAIIHKKPTPVQIVKVNYPKRSAAVITEAYFKQASTTDYNGVYKQRYVDYEAKETKNKTSFPLANFHEHQIKHMKSTLEHGGICFILIRFTVFDETYLIKTELVLDYWKDQYQGGRKSIPYQSIKNKGYLIPFHYTKRVDYLPIVDQLYF